MLLSMSRTVQRLLTDSKFRARQHFCCSEMARYHHLPKIQDIFHAHSLVYTLLALRCGDLVWHQLLQVPGLPYIMRSPVNWLPCLQLMSMHGLQAYRFNSAYADSITPELVDALSKFSRDGWRSVREERVPPDHITGHRWSSTALLVHLIMLSVHCNVRP